MNQRNRKRTVKELFHNRFYNTRFFWWSAEDRAWESMAPVGREFGSPDYERLMKEDADQWRAKLANLVAICSACVFRKSLTTVPVIADQPDGIDH